MITVFNGDNSLTYYTRQTQIDKYEILDHASRIVSSGITHIVGYDGKINHTGLTYDFQNNTIFTYKSYYLYEGNYYLAAHLLLQSFSGETSRLDAPFIKLDRTYSFRTFKPTTIVIYDFGSASYVGELLIDCGSASSVGDTIIDGKYI